MPVTEDSPANPYLEDPLRDVETLGGTRLTKINPAYMTRQIAGIASKEQGIHFHITSLKPVNPDNEPEDWERPWLEDFERGVAEQSALVQTEEGTVFRYMAPLFVESSCLKCHAKQGYREGQVRGAISVTIPGLWQTSNGEIMAGYGIAALSGLILIFLGGARLSRERELLKRSNRKLHSEVLERQKAEEKISKRNGELNAALSKVKLLTGFLPICSCCKKIRDDKGYWNQVESYIKEHSEAEFSHSICPECSQRLYPELFHKDETDSTNGT